ncbi:hypothetical protein ACFFJY_03355 [Fictibacillus aquaticus]|uniref:D-alanyl-lipoteichoic acid biosynthesis protein DltD n=1 Tax=Fictibacillus aquaticus TaxID=2021314 RepID=A0A235F9N2_9BACL|nr:hypothetical protein [Fictibacillus aquaticus]OYD57733.1 hypothetical protein CGZ90_13820 [Fictibacillus aquaticus]
MNKHVRWIMITMLLVLAGVVPLFAAVGYYNYKIDPLWNFAHANEYNHYQNGFDERQQKTNKITHNPFNYEALLIGTSRVTYMNQNDFKQHKTFNYSVSAMAVKEYGSYIEYAKKRNGKDFEVIYLELYFTSFDKNIKLKANKPDYYFKTSNEFLYKYKTLFSYSTLKRARFNKKISMENAYSKPRYYNRENIGLTDLKETNIPGKMERFKRSFNKEKITGAYPYNEEYVNMLKKLKKQNPNTKFVVFTEPIVWDRFELMFSDPVYWGAYERWYKDMTSVFDEIRSFQGKNSVNTNHKNFIDLYHYQPEVGTWMAHRLDNKTKDVPEDFGTKVSEENVDVYLNSIKSDLN